MFRNLDPATAEAWIVTPSVVGLALVTLGLAMVLALPEAQRPTVRRLIGAGVLMVATVWITLLAMVSQE